MDRLAAALRRGALAGALVATAAAAPAGAAWPGENGRLAFVTTAGGKQQVRVGPLDLRPSRRLAWFPPLVANLHMQSGYGQWDPSGRRLLFPRLASGFEVRSPRGRLLRRFPVDELYWPSWAPDGRRIVAIEARGPQRRLVVLRPGGRVLRRMALGVAAGQSASLPRWSPAGRWVVYEEATPAGLFLRRIDATDGSGDRRLGTGRMPAWAPGGERVAFADGPDVFTMRPDGSGRRRVAVSRRRDAWIASVAWSPDGRRIAFVRQDSRFEHDSSTLITLPSGGGAETVHRRTEQFVSGIDWQPR